MTAGDATKKSIPTVFYVAGNTVVELLYDAEQRRTCLAVATGGGTWRIEQEVKLESGEILTPYSPANNLIAHRCVMLPSRPDSSGTKTALLTDVRSFLHRYVDLSPTFEQIATHYVLLSWLYDAFAEVPYLRLRSEYGTGKTRGLLAIGSLCNRAFFAAGASTVSPIFHTLDRFGGTLVLDEADFRFSDATADLVKLFNNGNLKGLPVLRTMRNRQKEFNPVAFTVFGPKVIAMRGSFEDDALESRFLTEETGIRPLRPDVPLHLPDSFHGDALALRNRLLHYRLCHRSTTHPRPELAITGLDPRRNQISLPLLSLVDDPKLRNEIGEMLLREHCRARDERSRTLPARVLRATVAAFAAAEGRSVSVQAITDLFNAQQDRDVVITPRRLGAVLKSAFRVHTRKSNGTFVVDPADKPTFEELARRYGIHSADETRRNRSAGTAY